LIGINPHSISFFNLVTEQEGRKVELKLTGMVNPLTPELFGKDAIFGHFGHF